MLPPSALLALARPCAPLHALLRALAHRCLWRRLPKHSVIIQAGLVICSRRSFFLPLKLPFILLFWPPRRATTVNRRADRQCRGFCWWGRRTAVAKAFFLSQRRRATLTLAYFTEDNFVRIIISYKMKFTWTIVKMSFISQMEAYVHKYVQIFRDPDF